MPDTVTNPKITWRAAADRIAHASLPKARRTLCDTRIVPENLKWDHLRRCMVCRVAAEDLGWIEPGSRPARPVRPIHPRELTA